jgi:hypothetical protein
MARDTKTIKIALAGLEAQGARIVETRSGWQILCPSGDIVTMHATESDHRALSNTRSRIRRAGLNWPLDK